MSRRGMGGCWEEGRGRVNRGEMEIKGWRKDEK